MSQTSSLNDASSCTHIVGYYYPFLGFIDTPSLHAPVGINRDFGTDKSTWLPQHSWDSEDDKAHLDELLVNTDIIYFADLITATHFTKFCNTNKCKWQANRLF